MEHLGQYDLNCELKNGVNMCCDEECYVKEINTTSIQYAVKVLLMGLGEDINREGIIKTPHRVAKALCEGTRGVQIFPVLVEELNLHVEILSPSLLLDLENEKSSTEDLSLRLNTKGYSQSAKEIVEGALFPEAGVDNTKVGHAGGVGGLVIVRDLEFYSYCESCMLPFYFKCHVGYVPSGQRILGLSKLSRVANVFAKRLQEPQRLANEVCSALHQGIEPAGVAVVLQCTHINIPDTESNFFDSNHNGLVETLVSSGSGVFENKDADTWGDVFGLLKFRGIDKDKVHVKRSLDQYWCPSLSSKIGEINPIMVTAVSSILKSLGEDPIRKELAGTPSRYVKWLMNFLYCNDIDVKLNGSLRSGVDDSLHTNGEVSFDDKEVHSELNLPFWSQCEHHLLPFQGVVHIGYFIPIGFHTIAKSLLQSIVHFYGFKLQVQERLTKQIAETVSPLIGGNVIVVVEASHTCMISRGIEKFGSNTSTIAVLGRFSTDLAARTAFLESIPSAISL